MNTPDHNQASHGYRQDKDPNPIARGDKMDPIGQRVSSVLPFFLVCAWLCNAYAQDAMTRAKEFGIQSMEFDFPHVLHYEFLYSDENPVTNVSRKYRLLGRSVRVSDEVYRYDSAYTEYTPGDRRRRELYLQLSPKQRIEAEVGDKEIDIDFTSNTYGEGPGQTTPRFRRCNPYEVMLIGQGQTLYLRPSPSVSEIFEKFFASLDNSEIYLVHKNRAALYKFAWDERDTWKIRQVDVFKPGNSLIEALQYKKPSKTLDDCKEFKPVSRIEAKWRTLPNEVDVPFWSYHYAEKNHGSDPDRISEFEAFFFGFDMNPNIDQKFLDPERITLKDWNQDFNVAAIEELAAKEKKLYLQDRSRK